MCHELDSLPAVPRGSNIAVERERFILTASDGARFAAVAARPQESTSVGVLILPDNRGLSGFYGELAERLAESGHTALAIDYFGRTAGVDERGPEFPVMEHLMRVTRQGLDADIAAAVGHLRSEAGGASRHVFALGFCFGGRQAFLATTLGHRLTGVIGFYGFPGVLFGAPGPTQRAGDIASPVLAIWGGADVNMPPSEIAAFDEAMTGAGVDHEMVTYPGAPHSFFDIKHQEFAEVSADAWRRTGQFIRRYSAISESATGTAPAPPAWPAS